MTATATGSQDSLHQILHSVAEAVTGERGEDIFQELVYHAAVILRVKYAFIAELAKDVPGLLRVRAGVFNGRFEQGREYAIKGTPCESVVDQVFRFYPRDVRKTYSSPYLDELSVASYAAIPLFNSNNEAIGLMAIMDDTPLADEDLTYSTLRILSVRAAIELQRLDAHRTSRVIKEQYEAIFKKSIDGLILLRPDGRIVDVNPAWAAMHGYTRDEVLNGGHAPTFSQFIPKNSHTKFKTFLQHVAAGEAFQDEGEMKRKDGSLFLAEVRGVNMDYRGEPHYLAIVRDVTERREKQMALQKSQNRLRATIEAAMDCIIGMDQEGRIIEFNPTAEIVLGHRREEVLGKKLAELIIPQRYRAAHIEGLKRRRDGDHKARKILGKRLELSALRADGSEIPVELTIDVAQEEDQEIYFGYLRDLTERKRAEKEQLQLEAQLRQAQKMEAIGHLSGGIAHDFNNILTSIMGYLVLAQEKSSATQDEKLQHYLERAHNSGLRAKELIQQLLTFSRGQRGEARPLDLGPVVKESVKLMRSTLPSSIEIDTQISSTQLPVKLDPVQLEQILLNLCINARDAMQNHGRIRIEVANRGPVNAVCASCKQNISGDFIELRVTDSGTGIDPKLLDRIFEPFFTTKQTGSSGMGLSTVHGIVHDHGGHIVVEPAQPHGSVFRIQFPALQPLETDIGKQGESKSADHGDIAQLDGHVLIVDDEEQVAEFMADLFESRGMEATIITDSEAALRYCRKNIAQLDLVVTDQTMPKLTGILLAKELRQLRSDIPIILYSGYSDRITEHDVIRAGIDAFIKKPVDIAGLIDLTRDLLDRK